jgi:hypothetical protein
MPRRLSPQNSRTNFVDFPSNTRSFKEFARIPPKTRLIKVFKEQWNYVNLHTNFHAKRQGGGG